MINDNFRRGLHGLHGFFMNQCNSVAFNPRNPCNPRLIFDNRFTNYHLTSLDSHQINSAKMCNLYKNQ